MERQRPDDSTIAVLGADEANLELLRRMPGHERETFVPVLTDSEMQEGEVCIPDLLGRAVHTLDARERPVDGVVGFWDFPISTLVPLLADRYGLHAASLEGVRARDRARRPELDDLQRRVLLRPGHR